MTLSRTISATILLAMVAQPQPLRAEPRSPPGGSYEVSARLELPHLERWGVDKTTIICLPSSRGVDEIPVPVLSGNNPFAKCTAANLMTDGPKFEYDIVCPGRGAAKGHATYDILSRHIFWPCRDGDGRKKYDNDGSATCPPDRRVQPGEARISSPVLKVDRLAFGSPH